MFNIFNRFIMRFMFFHILKLSFSPKFKCSFLERLSGIAIGAVGAIFIDPLVGLWVKTCDKSYDLP